MKRAYWIGIAATLIACLLIATFIFQYQSKQFNKQFAAEHAQAQRLLDKKDAESEQHLTQHDHDHLDHTSDHTPDHATDKPIYKDSNASMPGIIELKVQRRFKPGEKHLFNWRYEDGIYKGMTYPEAYMAWKAKVKEARDRWIASGKKGSEISQAMIDSADAKLSTILTIFKSMPPDELKTLKSEILKEYPNKADDVESFFSDVANHSTTKSLEEIANDYEFILESDKSIWIAEEQNRAEVDKNYAELEQAKKEKPQRPTFE